MQNVTVMQERQVRYTRTAARKKIKAVLGKHVHAA